MFISNKIRRYWASVGLSKSYLTFTAAENNCTVQMYSVGMPNEIFLEYTTNGVTWQTYNFTTTEVGETTEHREGAVITLYEIGDFVQFRARKHSVDGTVIDYNTSWANFVGSSNDEPTGYYRWSFSNDVYASGNIQSLISHNARINTIYQGAYFKMFLDCTQLLSAPYLGGGKSTNLNDNTCQNRCYCYMFAGCTNIEEVEFPEWLTCGTHHRQFYNMFYGCSKLKHVSDLRFYSNNYQNNISLESMFENCTSMVVAPKILITDSAGNRNMGNSAFYRLFAGCTSLVDASLVDTYGYPNTYVYQDWSQCFINCTALKKIRYNFSPVGMANQGVHDFFANSGIEEIIVSPYPRNNVTRPLESLFKNCSQLKKITLFKGDWAYNMWSNYLATANGIQYYLCQTTNWVKNVASSGDFFCHKEKPKIFSPHFIPENWNVHHTNFNDWLCFTAAAANSTIRLNKYGSPDPIRLETSTDGTTWTEYIWDGNAGATITLASVGDKVYWRAVTENKTFSQSSNYHQFKMSGEIQASGNIQSLFDKFNATDFVPSWGFAYLFHNCHSLLTAPILGATNLSARCYNAMFSGCTSLRNMPLLPANTLTNRCYNGMFNGCTSLQYVEIEEANYNANCYAGMFNGCIAISKIRFRQRTWKDSYNSTTDWLNNVASSGTFVCHPYLDTTQRDASHVPDGWTVKTFAQDACDTYSDIDALVQSYPALADVINDHPDIVEKLHQHNGLVHSLVNTGYKPYMQCHGDRYEIKDTEGCSVYPYDYMSATLKVKQENQYDAYGVDSIADKTYFKINNYDISNTSSSNWNKFHQMLLGDIGSAGGNGRSLSIGEHEFYLSKTSIIVDGVSKTIGSDGYKTNNFCTGTDKKIPNKIIIGFYSDPVYYNDSKFISLVIKCWEGTADEETWCHIVPVADRVMANIADLDNIQFMQGTLQPQAVDDPTTYESRPSVFGLEQITA